MKHLRAAGALVRWWWEQQPHNTRRLVEQSRGGFKLLPQITTSNYYLKLSPQITTSNDYIKYNQGLMIQSQPVSFKASPYNLKARSVGRPFRFELFFGCRAGFSLDEGNHGCIVIVFPGKKKRES